MRVNLGRYTLIVGPHGIKPLVWQATWLAVAFIAGGWLAGVAACLAVFRIAALEK